MKKIFSKILGCTLALSVAISTLAGCSGGANNWEKPTLKNWGGATGRLDGGFVAETESYVYFVNGVPDDSADNTFGAPIKGALMVMDKANPSTVQTVVPKLFAAADYASGFLIWKDYVYYGTTNTDKAQDGSIAKDELVFERTKLDGTENERLLVPGIGLAGEYRIVKNGNDVYIVYYDTEETALKSFNATTKTESVIAKTDEKTEGNYSLGEYKFVEDANGEVALVYMVTVYNESYMEDKAALTGYARGTEAYNIVMAYKAGDTVDEKTGMLGKIAIDGEQTESSYTFAFNRDQFVFFNQTPISGAVKMFGADARELHASGTRYEIVNSAYVVEGLFLKALDEAYVVSESKVYRTTLIEDDKQIKQAILYNTDVSVIFDVIGSDLYYLNSSNELYRKEILNDNAKEVRVTNGAMITGWFAPEVVTIGEKTCLFYFDDSAKGLGYASYVDIGSQVIEEDVDDDGTIDKWYLPQSTFVGKRTEADKATLVGLAIDDIAGEDYSSSSGILFLEKNAEGKYYSEGINKAKAEYEALSAETKKLVDQEKLDKLAGYEKAVAMADVYAKLDGMYGYDNKTADEKAALRVIYEEVKGQIEAFIAGDDYDTIQAYIPTNLKANYSEAMRKFKA